MTFSVQTLSAFKMGSMIRVSNELLHDSAFDIASYIAQRLGRRCGNCEENPHHAPVFSHHSICQPAPVS